MNTSMARIEAKKRMPDVQHQIEEYNSVLFDVESSLFIYFSFLASALQNNR